MENFTQRLKRSGLKLTPQRETITDIIAKHGHIDVDKLYKETKKVLSSISLATLYKNIKLMQEKKLLRELTIEGQKSKYELNTKEHSHLICESCGEVKDINLELPKELTDRCQDFSVSHSNVTLYGLCKRCS